MSTKINNTFTHPAANWRNRSAFLFCLFLGLTISLQAQICATITWTGGNGNWDNPANWSGGNVPQDCARATIPAGVEVTIQSGNTIKIKQLVNAGQLTVQGNLTMEGDASGIVAISQEGTFINLGTTTIVDYTNSGSYGLINQFTGTFLNEGLLQISGISNSNGAAIRNDGGGIMTNNNTIVVQDLEAGSSSNFMEAINNNGTFTNNGDIVIQGLDDCTALFNSAVLPQGFVNSNNGSIDISNISGDRAIRHSGDFNNAGDLSISASSETVIYSSGINTNFTNSGSIFINARGEEGFYVLFSQLINSGSIAINSNNLSAQYGLRTNGGEVDMTGSLSINNLAEGLYNDNATFDLSSSATITINNTRTGVDNNAIVNTNGGQFNTVEGATININNLQAATGIDNRAFFENEGDISITTTATTTQAVDNSGNGSEFVNLGSLTVTGPSNLGFRNGSNAILELNDDSFSALDLLNTGTTQLENNGTIIGTGNIQAQAAQNFNSLSPGTSRGTINIEGNLAMNANGQYDYEIINNLTDRINVDGNLFLSGALNVTLSNTSPTDSDEYLLMTYTGTLAGTFSSVNLPAALNGFFVIYNEAGEVWLAGPNSPVAAPDCGTVIWLGGASGDWDEAINWSTGSVPLACEIVQINSGGNVTVPTGYTARAISVFNLGTLVNKGTLEIDVSQGNYFGLNNAGTTDNSGVINISNQDSGFSGLLNNIGANFVNNGEIYIDNLNGTGGDGVNNSRTATFTNNGPLFISNLTGNFREGLRNAGTFINDSDIEIDGVESVGLLNAQSTEGTASFTSTVNGDILVRNVDKEGIYNDRLFSNNGLINIANTGVNASGILNLGTNAEFSNLSNGRIVVESSFAATIHIQDSYFLNEGELDLTPSGVGDRVGLLIDDGQIESEGNIRVSDAVTGIDNGGNFNLNGSILIRDMSPSSNGIGIYNRAGNTWNGEDGSISLPDFTGAVGIQNEGTFFSSSALNMTMDNSTAYGIYNTGANALFQHGSNTMISGTAQHSILNENGATFRVNPSANANLNLVTSGNIRFDNSFGIVTGGGDINASLSVNTGTLSPGNSPGTQSFLGDLTLGSSSSYAFEKIETLSGVGEGQDLIEVTGDLTLDGTLDVSISGFTPQPGDEYLLLTYDGSLTGTFSTVNLPASLSAFTVIYDQPGEIWLAGPASALPVNWQSFEVSPTAENQALLVWSTSEEIDNKGFHVQHSPDGQIFQNVGWVASAEKTGANYYQFLHNTPNNGQNYYRLQQVDFDGSSSYSKIESLYLNTQPINTALAYPNPVQQRSTLTVSNSTVPFQQLSLSNQQGVVVWQQRFLEPQAQFNVSIKSLPTGTYVLRGDNTFVQLIVVQ